jgi:hypothetical protein
MASFLSRYFQSYPGQLSTTEVATIREVMRDERYQGVACDISLLARGPRRTLRLYPFYLVKLRTRYMFES